jgi:hypothetical protein
MEESMNQVVSYMEVFVRTRTLPRSTEFTASRIKSSVESYTRINCFVIAVIQKVVATPTIWNWERKEITC